MLVFPTSLGIVANLPKHQRNYPLRKEKKQIEKYEYPLQPPAILVTRRVLCRRIALQR